MGRIKELLASCVDPDKCESTAYPYWIIIDPKMPLASMDHLIHLIARAVTGPFFSREAAQEHLTLANHHFSAHAKVYCASGHASWQWQHLLRMGKHEDRPVAGPTATWRKGPNPTTVVGDELPADAVPGSDATEHYGGGYLIAESVAPSNVPLISAAPELLAAAKALDEHWMEGGHSPENAKSTTIFSDATIDLWKQFRAAIDKAEAK